MTSPQGDSMRGESVRSHGEARHWTVRDVLNWTMARLQQLDYPTPLLDAQLLLSSVLGLRKVDLYIQMDRPLSPTERLAMRDLVRRRIAGEPVAYLLQQKDWHDLDLFVDRRVLIPRPETETLLDFVLSLWRHQGEPAFILDLCTGSGCLAIALAKRFRQAKVVGVDIDPGALAVAQGNAARNHVPQVEFERGDVRDPGLYRSLAERFGRASIVVANPPYVTEEEWAHCDISVKDFEPRLALVAGEGGLEIGKVIAQQAIGKGFLAPDACFAMELGEGHPRTLAATLGNPPGISAFPANAPHWQLPRDRLFALRDWEERERFLCQIHGLQKAQEVNDEVGHCTE